MNEEDIKPEPQGWRGAFLSNPASAQKVKEKDLKPERLALREAFRSNPEGAEKLRDMFESGRIKAFTDMPTDEPLTIICVLWEGRLVRDCTRGLCDGCKRDVALAPSSAEIVATHKGPLVVKCTECALPDLLAEQAKAEENKS